MIESNSNYSCSESSALYYALKEYKKTIAIADNCLSDSLKLDKKEIFEIKKNKYLSNINLYFTQTSEELKSEIINEYFSLYSTIENKSTEALFNNKDFIDITLIPFYDKIKSNNKESLSLLKSITEKISNEEIQKLLNQTIENSTNKK